MNERVANLWVTEMSAKVAHERITPDAFDVFGMAMVLIELAASLRIPEVSPIGRLVAGARHARILNQGFQQDRTVGVAGVPIVGQASADQSERARSEIATFDPRQD